MQFNPPKEMDERTKKMAPYVMLGAGLAMFLVRWRRLRRPHHGRLARLHRARPWPAREQTMCALAFDVSLLAIFLIPAPGRIDHWEDMRWALATPWNASHGVQPPPHSTPQQPQRRQVKRRAPCR